MLNAFFHGRSWVNIVKMTLPLISRNMGLRKADTAYISQLLIIVTKYMTQPSYEEEKSI